MNYEALCKATVEIAIEAGSYIFGRINQIAPDEIEVKGKHNFVTEVDKAAEIMIINRLKDLVPGAGFIAEEGTTVTRAMFLTGSLIPWTEPPILFMELPRWRSALHWLKIRYRLWE